MELVWFFRGPELFLSCVGASAFRGLAESVCPDSIHFCQISSHSRELTIQLEKPEPSGNLAKPQMCFLFDYKTKLFLAFKSNDQGCLSPAGSQALC